MEKRIEMVEREKTKKGDKMSDLFTLETPAIRGRNKVIFYRTLQHLHNGEIVSISSFTQSLRMAGATISEESTSRYLRYLKDWNWGAVAISLGKGKYRIHKW